MHAKTSKLKVYCHPVPLNKGQNHVLYIPMIEWALSGQFFCKKGEKNDTFVIYPSHLKEWIIDNYRFNKKSNNSHNAIQIKPTFSWITDLASKI